VEVGFGGPDGENGRRGEVKVGNDEGLNDGGRRYGEGHVEREWICDTM
jgi:hypothetical protein